MLLMSFGVLALSGALVVVGAFVVVGVLSGAFVVVSGVVDSGVLSYVAAGVTVSDLRVTAFGPPTVLGASLH